MNASSQLPGLTEFTKEPSPLAMSRTMPISTFAEGKFGRLPNCKIPAPMGGMTPTASRTEISIRLADRSHLLLDAALYLVAIIESVVVTDRRVVLHVHVTVDRAVIVMTHRGIVDMAISRVHAIVALVAISVTCINLTIAVVAMAAVAMASVMAGAVTVASVTCLGDAGTDAEGGKSGDCQEEAVHFVKLQLRAVFWALSVCLPDN